MAISHQQSHSLHLCRPLIKIFIIILSFFLFGCQGESLSGNIDNGSIEDPDPTPDPEISTAVFGYGRSSFVFAKTQPSPTDINPRAPITSSISMNNFSVSPSLPPGLAMNINSGVISGAPTTVTEAKDYTVTAFDGTKIMSTTLSIEVMDGYFVNTFGYDTGDSTLNGECDSDNVAAGDCTLRSAIQEANNQPGKQAIIIKAGTIELASQLPVITEDVVIVGEQALKVIVDGGSASRILEVTAGTLDLRHVSIVNGRVANSRGAGVRATSNGVLKLNNIFFENNHAEALVGANGFGGAVYISVATSDTHTITESAFLNNTADSRAGAIYFSSSAGSLEIDNSYFESNNAAAANGGSGDGGAMYIANGGAVTLENTSFNKNFGKNDAGAVAVTSAGTVVDVYNSTFYENEAQFNGGSFYAFLGGVVNMTNVTLVKNSAGLAGAAVFAGTGGAQVNLNNSLLDGNVVGVTPDICGENAGTVTLVKNNYLDVSDAQCAEGEGTNNTVGSPQVKLGEPKIHGGLVPTIALNYTSPAIDHVPESDCSELDARSRPRIKTNFVSAGSEVCDAGAFEATIASAPSNLSYDRSWIALPKNIPMQPLLPIVNGIVSHFIISPQLPEGMNFDLNTGEISGTPTETSERPIIYSLRAINAKGAAETYIRLQVLDAYVVNTAADLGASGSNSDDTCDNGNAPPNNCSLRAAVEEANNTSGPQLIYLPNNTYTLGGTDLDINDVGGVESVYIVGESRDGVIIDGGNTSAVFDITNEVKMQYLTISNGNGVGGSSTSGGNFEIRDGAGTFDTFFSHVAIVNGDTTGGGDGGAAYIHSTSGINHFEYTLIKDNQSNDAEAGIWVNNNSENNFDHVIFDNNDNANHGALSITNGANANISKSLFINNDGGVNGAAIGIINNSSANVENTTFWNNNSTGAGAAIYLNGNAGNTLYLINSTVAENNNSSASHPGGVFINDGNVLSINSLFYSNTSASSTPNCLISGGVITHINSIETDDDCGFTSSGSQELSAGSINLQPLQSDLGRFIQVMPLPADSSAIDAGSNQFCRAKDARGESRAINGDGNTFSQCDVGAFEYNPLVPINTQ